MRGQHAHWQDSPDGLGTWWRQCGEINCRYDHLEDPKEVIKDKFTPWPDPEWPDGEMPGSTETHPAWEWRRSQQGIFLEDTFGDELNVPHSRCWLDHSVGNADICDDAAALVFGLGFFKVVPSQDRAPGDNPLEDRDAA